MLIHVHDDMLLEKLVPIPKSRKNLWVTVIMVIIIGQLLWAHCRYLRHLCGFDRICIQLLCRFGVFFHGAQTSDNVLVKNMFSEYAMDGRSIDEYYIDILIMR